MTIERYYQLILDAEEFRMLIDSVNLNEYTFKYLAIMTEAGDIEYRVEVSEEELENIIDDIASVIYEREDEYGYSSIVAYKEFKSDLYAAIYN